MSTTSSVFVSYSTNCEDVILNRLFGTQDSGFYVDVGAAHPLFGNDTKVLYDRGWRGINVEPSATFYRDLVAQRPGDRNINAAVSDTAGRLIFHEVVGSTALSTCDPEEAERAAAKGFEVVRHTVETVSLRQILEEAAPPEFDLLKVDVEGFEMKVLLSSDWHRFRPKLILVEATLPESPQRRPDVVTPYLAEQGYRRVYFDGLNDYYVECGFDPPPEVFDRPPNVFDHFETCEVHELKRAHEYHETCIASLQVELAERSRAPVEVEKQLRRTALVAEAYAVDIENARSELCALHERCRAFATQLAAYAIDIENVRSELENVRSELENVRSELENARSELENARSELHASHERCRDLATQLDAMYRSTSWRITRPLRGLARPRRALRILFGRAAD